MRLIYFLVVTALIGAVALPFILNGPAGVPLMNLSEVTEDVIPHAPTQVFQWRDEHGVVQFGDVPPIGSHAQAISIDNGNTTPMSNDWNLAPAAKDAVMVGGATATLPSSPFAAYKAAPQLIDASKRATAKLNARAQDMDDLLSQIAEANKD
jgi:hypothetical protein